MIYQEICLDVKKTQAKRVDDANCIRSANCECEGCLLERQLRQQLEAMPEHQEAKSKWVAMMQELRDASMEDPFITSPRNKDCDHNDHPDDIA